MSALLVQGEVHFEQPPNLPLGATAYVRLLDTSLADAPSSIVAEQVLTGIAADANAGRPLLFALYGTPPNARASYTVSIWVDVDSDGRISSGDYLTMQSYPVLTYGYPNQVTVQVRRVK